LYETKPTTANTTATIAALMALFVFIKLIVHNEVKLQRFIANNKSKHTPKLALRITDITLINADDAIL
jgi:hypothetical protein